VCAPLAPIESSTEIIIGENPPRALDVKISRLRDWRANVTGRLLILRDMTESKRAQAALRELNTNLERAVTERTEELQITVARLQTEVAERKRVEASLREMEESLAQRVAEQSRQLTALYQVILVAEQSDSINEMRKQALATILNAMNCQAGCIHQRDEEGGALHLIAQNGLNASQQTQIEILPSDWLSNDNIPHVVIDLATDTRVPGAIRLPGLASYLGVPTHSHGKPTGALGIFWREPRALGVEDIALFSAMADQLDLIVENARLREKSQVAAVQQERRRLARDLHDSVTQSLHSLVLSADTTRALAQRRQLELLDPTVTQLAESARQALKEMRLMLFELRLATLDRMDLVEQLETRLDLVERRAGVDAQFDVDPMLSLPPEWTRELYPIAMEALNNTLRYAQATHVRVTLRGKSDSFRFEIADNGKGFDTQHPRAGMGLQSMRERAERLGGSFAIESAPGQGTRVSVRIARGNS
jgi:signal transduction histidine kinase